MCGPPHSACRPGWQGPPHGTTGSTATAAASTSSSVVLQNLTRLQRGELAILESAGLSADRLTDGQTNLLHELRRSPLVSDMGQRELMTLDLVALIFDHILDDRRIPDAIKALIGRLQIPVLKVAMLDPTFFSQRNHPARRLLDVLAEASMGWEAQEGHDSGLYRKMEETVQGILRTFDDRIDVFTAALADFEHYLAEEKKLIDTRTGQNAQILYTREQRALAEIVAHDALQVQLFDRVVPDLIRDFLYGPWQEVLTRIHAAAGESSPAWQEALQTAADLIWSVAPKGTADERQRLVSRLPGLLKRLSDGLDSIDWAAAERDRFFAALMRCHAEAVRHGMRGEASPATHGSEHAAGAVAATGSPDFASTAHLQHHEPTQPDEPGTAPAATMETFEPLDTPAAPIEVEPVVMQEVAATPTVGVAAAHGLGGKTQGTASAADSDETLLACLKRGTWIEIRQADGSLMRAKLAWISPMRGVYLFTNRLGLRAMSIGAAGLAAKLRTGEIQVIDPVPLVDQAFDALLDRLQAAG
ncbi:MAG: DUF1631 domain-containing protein [Thiobacillaceae bacterium]|nr:DUF1631 domain-containing protein [Thiobacillaceae bacterium]